ncbi:MAG: NAD-dependent epimerase/dehydratase family protein [Acidobacteria bacterium ACB1]|nr:3 beta-hydroxysteroid dehydrogenase/Delta 5-->4-isomerase [Pyrinomonadaceae bacterium]MCE7963622.1 NAD-dependent epimerase/dehydratase family protein [Acidobacteria bacterium ACB1]RIJ90433.1 MAG: epimerase [Acidobacteriota bacterium]
MTNQETTHCLITGGAGFLGINLIRYLLQKNWAITSFDKAGFKFDDVVDSINVVRGDVRDRERLSEAMNGVDIVVHTAAALPLDKRSDIFSTEVEGTRNVLEAAFTAGVKRVIHISSTAVYGIPDHHPLVEGDRLEGVGAYGEAKILAEEVCLEYRKRGFCVPILRPKSFVGPERLGVFALLYEWALEGHNFPLLGRGNNKYQLLDVEDLCDAIYLAATVDSDRANDTFNVGAMEFESLATDFQAVLDEAGHGKHIRRLPAGPAIAVLKLLERLGLSPLYKWIYETADKESFVSIDKAVDQLGFHPKFSNEEALRRNFDWYRANESRFHNTSGTSHTVPWRQGALRMAKIFF